MRSRATTDRLTKSAIALVFATGAALAPASAFAVAFGSGFAPKIGDIRAAFRKAENTCKAYKSDLHDQFLESFVKPLRDGFEQAVASGPEAAGKIGLVKDIQVRVQESDGKISDARPLKLKLKVDGQNVTGYEIIDPTVADASKATVTEESILQAYLDPDCKRSVSLGQVVDQTIVPSKVEQAEKQRMAEADEAIREVQLMQAVQVVTDTKKPLSLTNPARGPASPVEAASRNLKDPDAVDDTGGAVQTVSEPAPAAPAGNAAPAAGTVNDVKPSI